MFGEDIRIRQLKKSLAAGGCDMDAVKNWQRQVERMKKQFPKEKERIETARTFLEEAGAQAKDMEKLLIGKDGWSRERAKTLSEIRKELKKMKDSYIHEFLVTKDDKDFHLTYETLLRLSDKYDGSEDKRLILQSETENLLAMIRENLEKEQPELLALSYFYITGNDGELSELSHRARLEKITGRYEREIIRPMEQQLAKAADADIKNLHEWILKFCTE